MRVTIAGNVSEPGHIGKLYGTYYYVTRLGAGTGTPIGIALTGYKRRVKSRKEYGLADAELIVESRVPDMVWAALAEWRMTS